MSDDKKDDSKKEESKEIQEHENREYHLDDLLYYLARIQDVSRKTDKQIKTDRKPFS